MVSYHAGIREKVLRVMASAATPLPISDIFERVEALMLAEEPLDAYDLEVTGDQTAPRWQVRVRSIVATLAQDQHHVVRVSKGVYAAITLSPEDLEVEDDDDTQPSALSWIYAYSLAMFPGHLKVGRSVDLMGRIQQHRLQHANACLPDAPYVEAAWRVADAHAAERALHGLLTLRAKHYKGSGGGREWFNTDVATVQELLDMAIGHPVPPEDVHRFNDS